MIQITCYELYKCFGCLTLWRFSFHNSILDLLCLNCIPPGCWHWSFNWLSRMNQALAADIQPLLLVLLYFSSDCSFLVFLFLSIGTSTLPWLGLTCQELTSLGSQITFASQIASMLPELVQSDFEIASFRLKNNKTNCLTFFRLLFPDYKVGRLLNSRTKLRPLSTS